MGRLLSFTPAGIALFAIFLNPLLPADNAWLAAIRILLGFSAVLLTPGYTLLRLIVRGPLTIFDTITLSAAISIIITEGLCAFSLLIHVPTHEVMRGLLLSTIGVSMLSLLRPSPGGATELPSRLATAGIAACLVVAVALYFEGGVSAWSWHPTAAILTWEDALHINIIQRLMTLAQPAISDLLPLQGVVYTYPFPGTHYLFALAAQAAAIGDAVFVYDKARPVLWLVTVAAYWRLARDLTNRREIADFLPLVFSLAVIAGGLARLPGLYSGQVAPTSHAAVVAAEAWLPLLLAITVRLADRTLPTGLWRLHWVLAFGMAATLIAVHPRQVVQELVYVGTLAAALAVFGRDWRRGAKVGGLAVAITAAMLAYLHWHSAALPWLQNTLAEGRHTFLTAISGMPWWRFIGPLDPDLQYVYGLETYTLKGLSGILMAITPLMLWRFRRQPAMVMAGASMAAFMLMAGVGGISILVILATNDEMLMMPAQNWAIFLRVILVAALFEAGVLLQGRRRRPLVAALVAGLATWGISHISGPWFSLIYVPVFVALAIVLWLIWRRGMKEDIPAPLPGSVASGWLIPALIVCFGILAAIFDLTAGPLGTVSRAWHANIPGQRMMQLLEGEKVQVGIRPHQDCAPTELSIRVPYRSAEATARIRPCLPPPELLEWGARALPPEAVVAVNILGWFYPQPFLNVQVPAMPRGGQPLRDARATQPDVAREFDRLPPDTGQPIFNDDQPEVDILGSITRLRVTHILLDPPYSRLRPNFLRFGWLHEVWHSGEWSVFAVEAGNAPR